MFLIPPALKASLGSYYRLSGFVIPHYSMLLNHLVQHVEIVHFKILDLKMFDESSETNFYAYLQTL